MCAPHLANVHRAMQLIYREFRRNYMRLVVAFSLFTWRRIDAEPRIGNWFIDHGLAAAVCALTCLFMWGELTALRVAGWADYLPDFCEYSQHKLVAKQLPSGSLLTRYCCGRELVGLDMLHHNDDGSHEVVEAAGICNLVGAKNAYRTGMEYTTCSALRRAAAPTLGQGAIFSARFRRNRCLHYDDRAHFLQHSLFPRHLELRSFAGSSCLFYFLRSVIAVATLFYVYPLSTRCLI